MKKTWVFLLLFALMITAGVGCSFSSLPVIGGSSPDTLVPQPTYTFPPTLTQPPPTPLPSPTMEMTDTAAPDSPASATPTAEPTEPIPPLSGSFDVYLSAPDESGMQLLDWVDTDTGEIITEVEIMAQDGEAKRAGEFVYYVEALSRQPQRVNSAGYIESLSFASPQAGAAAYQMMTSSLGQHIAWLELSSDGQNYTISLAQIDGASAKIVTQGQLQPGMQIELLRVANDGGTIFYDMRPAEPTFPTVFNPRHDIYKVTAATGEVTQLPGEPACGAGLVCDAYISLDGTFLARTLPFDQAVSPVVVTNLSTSQAVGRFAPIGNPAGAAVQIGYPFFTPGGQLIYMIAYGPAGLEEYVLIMANLVTGEQTVVAELGPERFRPLTWSGNGEWLLATREPDVYDTWQINIETGEKRSIAATRFLGHIVIP